MILTDTIYTTSLNTEMIPYRIIMPSVVYKTCLWLHGYQERSESILLHSDLEALAEAYQVAVLLPDVPDTYYLNQHWNDCYTEDFLIKEFLPAVAKKYHLPCDSIDTIIAGISMGGFGSLLLGSHFPNLFGKIISISGAFIIDDLLIGNPEVVGNYHNNILHFQNIFYDIPSLEDCPIRNPKVAAQKALADGNLPSVFFACGTEDLLYTRNRKLRKLLENNNADVSWHESPGNHEWNYFNIAIRQAFEWI